MPGTTGDVLEAPQTNGPPTQEEIDNALHDAEHWQEWEHQLGTGDTDQSGPAQAAEVTASAAAPDPNAPGASPADSARSSSAPAPPDPFAPGGAPGNRTPTELEFKPLQRVDITDGKRNAAAEEGRRRHNAEMAEASGVSGFFKRAIKDSLFSRYYVHKHTKAAEREILQQDDVHAFHEATDDQKEESLDASLARFMAEGQGTQGTYLRSGEVNEALSEDELRNTEYGREYIAGIQTAVGNYINGYAMRTNEDGTTERVDYGAEQLAETQERLDLAFDTARGVRDLNGRMEHTNIELLAETARTWVAHNRHLMSFDEAMAEVNKKIAETEINVGVARLGADAATGPTLAQRMEEGMMHSTLREQLMRTRIGGLLASEAVMSTLAASGATMASFATQKSSRGLSLLAASAGLATGGAGLAVGAGVALTAGAVGAYRERKRTQEVLQSQSNERSMGAEVVTTTKGNSAREKNEQYMYERKPAKEMIDALENQDIEAEGDTPTDDEHEAAQLRHTIQAVAEAKARISMADGDSSNRSRNLIDYSSPVAKQTEILALQISLAKAEVRLQEMMGTADEPGEISEDVLRGLVASPADGATGRDVAMQYQTSVNSRVRNELSAHVSEVDSSASMHAHKRAALMGVVAGGGSVVGGLLHGEVVSWIADKVRGLANSAPADAIRTVGATIAEKVQSSAAGQAAAEQMRGLQDTLSTTVGKVVRGGADMVDSVTGWAGDRADKLGYAYDRVNDTDNQTFGGAMWKGLNNVTVGRNFSDDIKAFDGYRPGPPEGAARAAVEDYAHSQTVGGALMEGIGNLGRDQPFTANIEGFQGTGAPSGGAVDLLSSERSGGGGRAVSYNDSLDYYRQHGDLTHITHAEDGGYLNNGTSVSDGNETNFDFTHTTDESGHTRFGLDVDRLTADGSSGEGVNVNAQEALRSGQLEIVAHPQDGSGEAFHVRVEPDGSFAADSPVQQFLYLDQDGKLSGHGATITLSQAVENGNGGMTVRDLAAFEGDGSLPDQLTIPDSSGNGAAGAVAGPNNPAVDSHLPTAYPVAPAPLILRRREGTLTPSDRPHEINQDDVMDAEAEDLIPDQPDRPSNDRRRYGPGMSDEEYSRRVEASNQQETERRERAEAAAAEAAAARARAEAADDESDDDDSDHEPTTDTTSEPDDGSTPAEPVARGRRPSRVGDAWRKAQEELDRRQAESARRAQEEADRRRAARRGDTAERVARVEEAGRRADYASLDTEPDGEALADPSSEPDAPDDSEPTSEPTANPAPTPPAPPAAPDAPSRRTGPGRIARGVDRLDQVQSRLVGRLGRGAANIADRLRGNRASRSSESGEAAPPRIQPMTVRRYGNPAPPPQEPPS